MDQHNPRTDRKTVEKNRRNHMKDLYSQLNSLVPHQNTKEATSLPDQLDEAAKYIKKLQVSLERMKEKKNSLARFDNNSASVYGNAADGSGGISGSGSNVESRVEIHEVSDSALEVVLTTGLGSQHIFNETVRILHVERADIVNASFSVVNADTVFHTIHCQLGGYIPSLDASRISQRLKKFIEDSNKA